MLLFPAPDADRSWAFIENDPDREELRNRKIYPVNRHELDEWFSFHRLIAALDDCPYTHAALVLKDGDDPVLANSDEHGLREIRASELKWEYPDPLLVRRLRAAGDKVREAVRQARVHIGAGTPAGYPYIDMLPVAHLLASRNRPLHLPLLDHAVQRTLRRVADHAQWDNHVLGLIRHSYEQFLATLGDSEHPLHHLYAERLTFMCAAFVVQVLQEAGVSIQAPLRRFPDQPPSTTVTAAEVGFLVGTFIKVYGGHKSKDQVGRELEDALHYVARHLASPEVRSWSDWRQQFRTALETDGPFPAPEKASAVALTAGASAGRGAGGEAAFGSQREQYPKQLSDLELLDRAATAPIQPMFATAYDLQHCDELETVGQWFW